METSANALLHSCRTDLLNEIVEQLRSRCAVSDLILNTIKQSVFPISSDEKNVSQEDTVIDETPIPITVTKTNGYGNQGHGKLIEKNIAALKYGVNISKYSHVNKYDIECIDNTVTHKNVSIKTTKNNLVCCGDVFNFLRSENCEMIIVRYNQYANTKEIERMLSLQVDDVVAHYDSDKLNDLIDFRSLVLEKKRYFQNNGGNLDEVNAFRQYCKLKSKELSTELIRINAKISTPKELLKHKFRCDNFRIQCSVNLDTLKDRVIDISHELQKYAIPLTISSLPRNRS
jgi:hypothetical protein